MTHTRKEFYATLNGHPCWAYRDAKWKVWMVGGDFAQSDQVVQILAKKNGRLGWHTLRNGFLIFSDFASADELAQADEFLKARKEN